MRARAHGRWDVLKVVNALQNDQSLVIVSHVGYLTVFVETERLVMDGVAAHLVFCSERY